MRNLGIWGLFLCATLNLAAQEEAALIYRIKGDDFALTLNGARTVFPADFAAAEGVSLARSGIVHTGPETFLELKFFPSGTVVTLSENTSLVYNGVDEVGKFLDMGLLYGRIRIVTGTEGAYAGAGAAGANVAGANPAGLRSVVIRGGGVSARLHGGDMGVEYLLGRDNHRAAARPLFRAYAFRGSAEIFAHGKGTPVYFGEAGIVTAAEGESLSVDMSPGFTFVEKKSPGKDMADYWLSRDFEDSPLPAPAAAIPSGEEEPSPATLVPSQPGDAPAIVFAEPPENGRRAAMKPGNRRKNLILGLGLALTAASVAIQGISYSRFDTSSDSMARKSFQAAYIPMGLGLISLLAGIAYNP